MFPFIGFPNYRSWVFSVSALLRVKGIWDVVDNSRQVDLKDNAAVNKANSDRNIALGILQLSISESQHSHIHGITEPVAFWTALEKVHKQKSASTRFVAYNALFSIVKKEDESLQTLATRVVEAIQKVRELCPDPFTLDQLDVMNTITVYIIFLFFLIFPCLTSSVSLHLLPCSP